MSLIIFLVSSIAFGQQRVAVFDFDDRLDSPGTVAKYIEQKLKEQVEPNLIVDQFSGEEDDKVTRDTLKSLDASGYDLVVTVTSDALVPAQHYLTKTPALFTNVNNPLFLGLNTLEAAGGNMSGASYYVPIEKQLKLFMTLQPAIKTLGFIFDNEAQSKRIEVAEVRKSCKNLGIEHELEFVSEKSELLSAAADLIHKKVDAIVVSSSGKIYKNVDLFVGISTQEGIPVYSFHKSGVEKGAVAALASDYYVMVDKLIIPMAQRVLKEGVSPGMMPVAFLEEPFIFLNLTQASRLGITVPDEIKAQAIQVY